MMISFQYFCPADLIPILKITARSFTLSYQPAVFLASGEAWHQGFIVARLGSKVVAYVMGQRLAREARILLFAVLPEYRGKGLGSRLLACFEQEVLKDGLTRIFLEVRAGNTRAQGFYGIHGFARTSVRPRFYSDGEGAVVMSKSLTS